MSYFYFFYFFIILFIFVFHLYSGRIKSEDKSLNFQIIPACPLLKIIVDGINSQNNTNKMTTINLLPGQILQSILILKNEGLAAATNISLKFSHPNFILAYLPNDENDENRMKNFPNNQNLLPFYGQSCTVLKLNSREYDNNNNYYGNYDNDDNKSNIKDLKNLVINPGEEVRYGLYLKMVETGDHTVSILSSYTAYHLTNRNKIENENVDGDESENGFSYKSEKEKGLYMRTNSQSTYGNDGECHGSGLKCRTSILSFEVRKYEMAARMTIPSLVVVAYQRMY